MTGSKVNINTGYDQKVPCSYLLYGLKTYIDKLKKIVENLQSMNLI